MGCAVRLRPLLAEYLLRSGKRRTGELISNRPVHLRALLLTGRVPDSAPPLGARLLCDDVRRCPIRHDPPLGLGIRHDRVSCGPAAILLLTSGREQYRRVTNPLFYLPDEISRQRPMAPMSGKVFFLWRIFPVLKKQEAVHPLLSTNMQRRWVMVAVALVLASHPGCAFFPSLVPISRAGRASPIAQAPSGRCRLPLHARAAVGRGGARMSAEVGAGVDPREFQAKSEVLAALADVQDPTRGASVVSLRLVSGIQVHDEQLREWCFAGLDVARECAD